MSQSLLLRRSLLFVLSTGGVVYGARAFATCGESGRPPCRLETIEVEGHVPDRPNLPERFEPCADGSCDPFPDPPSNNGDSGGSGGETGEAVTVYSPEMQFVDMDCRVEEDIRRAYVMGAIEHYEEAMGFFLKGSIVEISYYSDRKWIGTEQFIIASESNSEPGLIVVSRNGCQPR